MSSMHMNLCVLTVCLRGNIIIIMIKFMICKWIIIIYDSLRIYEFWIGKQLSVSVYVKCHILVKVCVFFLLFFGKIKCVQINFENLFGLFDLPIVCEKNARFSVCVCGLCCLANIKKKNNFNQTRSRKCDRAKSNDFSFWWNSFNVCTFAHWHAHKLHISRTMWCKLLQYTI